MKKLFIANEKKRIINCYGDAYLINEIVVTNKEFFDNPLRYNKVEVIFSTWGIPILTKDEIKQYFPNLKIVFYGAGSVQQFALSYLELGIIISSAWKANAIPVAEWTVAQIILANKGFYQIHQKYSKNGIQDAIKYAETFPGNYHEMVGLIGIGSISRHVIELLKNHNLKIFAYSTYLTENEAEYLGIKLETLEFIFRNCQTISNHLPDKNDNKKILDYKLFSKMKTNATFINTGRGAQINLDDLILAMKEEPDRTALLDVTDPEEPLSQEHNIWKTNNIYITPHRAGSMVNEVFRMGDYMKQEYSRYLYKEELVYEVTLDIFNKMA